jgi:hypothetical protein
MSFAPTLGEILHLATLALWRYVCSYRVEIVQWLGIEPCQVIALPVGRDATDEFTQV